jgi:hypothetical protein
MQSYVSEAIDKVDEFPEIVEEGLVCLLYLLHIW